MNDLAIMQLAINEAKKGIFSTAPNPRVGCVIVKDNVVVGAGYHRFAGEGHAEVNALAMAGDKSVGAAAYVTLEPCAHHGRTPPCAEALIKAGIKKVFIACTDPNPLVAGKGIKILNAAGIKTEIGLCQAEALHLNRGFFKRITTGKPFVTLKLAASLDGKTALANGKSQWITSETARMDVQKERLMADAIIAGTGSVIDDNARLTARYQTDLPHKQPLRVVIDSQLKMPSTVALFKESTPILIAHNCAHIPQQLQNFPHVEFIHCGDDRHVDLNALLKELGSRGVNNVFVEAGASLAGAFLQAKLVDEMLIYLAPTLLGQDARSLALLPLLTDLSDRMQFIFTAHEQLGSELKLCLQASSQLQANSNAAIPMETTRL